MWSHTEECVAFSHTKKDKNGGIAVISSTSAWSQNARSQLALQWIQVQDNEAHVRPCRRSTLGGSKLGKQNSQYTFEREAMDLARLWRVQIRTSANTKPDCTGRDRLGWRNSAVLVSSAVTFCIWTEVCCSQKHWRISVGKPCRKEKGQCQMLPALIMNSVKHETGYAGLESSLPGGQVPILGPHNQMPVWNSDLQKLPRSGIIFPCTTPRWAYPADTMVDSAPFFGRRWRVLRSSFAYICSPHLPDEHLSLACGFCMRKAAIRTRRLTTAFNSTIANLKVMGTADALCLLHDFKIPNIKTTWKHNLQHFANINTQLFSIASWSCTRSSESLPTSPSFDRPDNLARGASQCVCVCVPEQTMS